jgi:hypothetical protein
LDSRERGAIFRQSLLDFPCPVTLGKYTPSFGLHRFKQGLRFVPYDDEGFTLRGDKQRLIYKGRRRSHRFTILGDTSFEYDCILLKEPDTNIVSLRMEGAENFDFFHQPDFVPDQFLKGSYAVYKKETLVGEGTGKLCHIHRPEIIDARGRRCWGELAVIENELRITIPEWFLSEAKYPVVVDPTIGTTTVGSQYKWDIQPPEPWIQLYFEGQLPVNRFFFFFTINGLCTAYMYSNDDNNGESGGRPALYSDNGNSPLTRYSKDEEFSDFTVNNSKPAGWRSATFNSNGKISSGSYIWFGVFADFYWEPRFDYGTKCYCDCWYDVGDSIPSTYPLYKVNLYFDFKLSMYFTYTSAQNYVRTLTQGIKLTDNKVLTADYKRKTEQTVQTETTTNKLQTVYRRIQEAVKCNEYLLFPVLIVRRVYEAIKVYDTLKRLRIIFIRLLENIFAYGKVTGGNILLVKITDTVSVAGVLLRSLFLFVRIITDVFMGDYLFKRFLVSKTEVKLKSCVTKEIILESRIN